MMTFDSGVTGDDCASALTKKRSKSLEVLYLGASVSGLCHSCNISCKEHLPVSHVSVVLLVQSVEQTALGLLLIELGNVLKVAADKAKATSETGPFWRSRVALEAPQVRVAQRR